MVRARLDVFWTILAAVVLQSGIAAAGENRWTRNSLVLWGNIVGDPATPGALYTRSEAGLVRSTDNGLTWSPLGIDAEPLAVGPATTVYAGSYTFRGGYNVIVISKTTDSGAHWSTIAENGSPAPPFMPRFAVDQTSPSTVYRMDTIQIAKSCSLVNSLRRSADGGLTWTPSLNGTAETGPIAISALAVDPSTAGTVYASVGPIESYPCGRPSPPSPAVLKSTDAGQTWVALPQGPQGASGLAVDPQSPATLYAANGGTLFRSTDAGATFTQRSASLPPVLSGLAVDPAHSNRLYASSNAEGVFASADGGAGWSPINAGLDQTFVQTLVVDPSGDFLHVSSGGSLYDYQVVHAPTVLSLDPGRVFRVTVDATNPRTGESGAGLATVISSIAGYFSLPALTGDPANPEVFVKILDGTGVTGAWWVFYGGLTSFEYTLTVTDEVTGQAKTYTKPAGSACGGFDTEAFPSP